MTLKLLPLQGVLLIATIHPGRCPGLGASALSGRVELSRVSLSYIKTVLICYLRWGQFQFYKWTLRYLRMSFLVSQAVVVLVDISL